MSNKPTVIQEGQYQMIMIGEELYLKMESDNGSFVLQRDGFYDWVEIDKEALETPEED